VITALDQQDPAYLAIDGRMVTPYGQTVATCTFPGNGAISPDGTEIALICNGNRDINLKNQRDQSVRIIDAATLQQKKVLELPYAFFGVTYSSDGKTLIVSGGQSGVAWRFDLTNDYAPLPRVTGLAPNVAGIAAPASYPAVFVAEEATDMVTMADTTTGNVIRKFPVCRFPFDLAMDEAKSKLYVSCAMDDRIAVIDLGGGPSAMADITVGYIDVGANPTALAVGPDSRVWVVLSGEDKVAVVNPDAGIVAGKVEFSPQGTPLGRNLTDVAVSPKGDRVWVTLGHENAVAVVDPKDLTVKGYIPTAWYPIWVAQSGNTLLVASAKGFGTGPNEFDFDTYQDVSGDGTRTFFGTISRIDLDQVDGCLTGRERHCVQTAIAYGVHQRLGGTDVDR
jgi:DNA-binding beta-propeller fold protein YncE